MLADEATFAMPPLANWYRTREGIEIWATLSTEATDPEAYERFPEQPLDPRRLAGMFDRFGLPDRLR